MQLPQLHASSAGTRAVVGHPIHPHAARALEDLGGDAGDFAARTLTSRVATDADLILTMSEAHRDAVLELAPRQLRSTFTLGEAARLTADGRAANLGDLSALRPTLAGSDRITVPDPIGEDPDFHVRTAELIADLLVPVLAFCRRLE